ncbi:MAG: hypothetical protein GMKNLPBB_00203 [Myxococcota bacterium]|nr:hypothetical protein [Myxococcota bacterium]
MNRMILFAALCLLMQGCSPSESSKKASQSSPGGTNARPAAPAQGLPFTDNFDRAELGPDWQASGCNDSGEQPCKWEIRDGMAYSPYAHNTPLWLNRSLPADVRIEFDILSKSPDFDMKVELFGDGQRHESGYSLIAGGWKNTISCIARLGEHEPKRLEKMDSGNKPNITYRWRIERKGGQIKWFVNDALYMEYADANPLKGPGHDRFALSNWRTQAYYDNLRITALE